MPDGTNIFFDSPPIGEALRPLEELPEPVVEMMHGLKNEFADHYAAT